MKQDENESIIQFTKRFNNEKDIMETQHGKLRMEKYLATIDGYSTMTVDQKKDTANEQYNKLMAFAYLKGLDQKRCQCGKLVEDLGNQYALGEDKFPPTIAKATDTVASYKNKGNNPSQQRGNGQNNNRNNGNNNGNKSNNNGDSQGQSFGQTGNWNFNNNNN